jgi:hypothetical protein
MEVWKDIKGYEGLYQVSNLGRVKSLCYYGGKKEKIIKGGVNPQGYIIIGLNKNNKRTSYTEHRLVALAFLDNPNNYPVINHKNGIKTDNRVENLEWCTYQQNTIHAFETGLKFGYKGEKHGMCKLTNDQVLAIRADNRLHRIIAKEYNVDRSTIGYGIIYKLSY